MDILCPDCGAPIAGTPACTSCGLNLQGPTAGRLWQVDQRLFSLDAERGALTVERVSLLAALRTGTAPQAPVGAATAPTVVPTWSQPAAARKESSPKSVQNTLLSLGALLLAGAGLVFAAVTYNALGVVGRALVLLLLTAGAGAAVLPLRRKGLQASAEAVGGVTLVLAAVDAWALRHAGLAQNVEASSYAAVATGLYAGLAGAWASAVPLRITRIAATLAAHLPLIFVLTRIDASPWVVAVAVSLQAAGSVAVANQKVPKDVAATLAGLAGLQAIIALLTSSVALDQDGRPATWGFLALAGLATFTATQVRDQIPRALVAGTVPGLLALGAFAASRADLTDSQQPLVATAVALLTIGAAQLLRGVDRPGPVLGALLVAGIGVLAEAEAIAVAFAGPLTWLADPWTFAGTAARAAVREPWTGSIATLVVLLGAAGAAAAGGHLLDRLREGVLTSVPLALLGIVVLPLALDLSLHATLALLVGLSVALTAGIFYRTELALGGIALGLFAAAWSTAEERSTLTVVPLIAVLAAVGALRLPGALTSLTVALVAAETAAVGVHQDLHTDQVGALLLVVVAAAVGLSYLLGGLHRVGLEACAAVVAATAIGLTAEEDGWLTWSLAISGLLALAVAIRSDRRYVGLVGGLLLSASSWVRLVDANVEAPEPYVLPLAFVALVFGYLRRRETPGTDSFQAYGPGLTLALLPTLLRSVADDTPTRGLLLLVACAAVVLAGVHDRLRAPLVLGGGVLLAELLNLLGPYATALPRWMLLAATGGLLLGIGATYEQRLQDLARLRARYDTWA